MGDVATVVTRAITTIMAKSLGEMTPMFRPMSRTMRPMSPRVFIIAPRAAAERASFPAMRAARKVPPNFPSVAATMIAAQMSQLSHPETSPISVRNPVSAKNAGRSSTVTTSLSLWVNSRASRESWGITAPSRNAPNTACTPMASVASAESSTATNAMGIAAGGSAACVFALSIHRQTLPTNGRTTKNIPRMKASAASATRAASPTWA